MILTSDAATILHELDVVHPAAKLIVMASQQQEAEMGDATNMVIVLAGVALWGLHMGLTQGVLAAMVADPVQPDLRGTAVGVFNLASGVALLLASVVAGLLWDLAGSKAVFLTGAAVSLLALSVSARMQPGHRGGRSMRRGRD